MYSFLNKEVEKVYSKNTLVDNYQKILIVMTPILPHFANECLSIIKAKNFKWPEYDISMLKEETINIVIQINGKKRGLIQSKPNISEEKLFEIIKNDEKIMKYFDQKNIKKKIYIKDKILNIII
jgi:leucyl-tRNA synthetase